MRTTIDLPDELLEEAQRLSGSRTKRAAVVTALESYVKERHRQELIAMLGKTPLNLTHEQLREMRQGDTDPDPDAPLCVTLPLKERPPWLSPKR
jgi:Arc/MetJ family transcription regulator